MHQKTNQPPPVGGAILCETTATITSISDEEDKITFAVEESEVFDVGSSVTLEIAPYEYRTSGVSVGDRVAIGVICCWNEAEKRHTPDPVIYRIEPCSEVQE